MRDFEEATERVVLGPERKSRIISQREKEIIAYHEAGHAVAMHMLPKCDPVRKVTIVARGIAGGVTWSMPEDDTMLGSRTEYLHMIAGALGGRAAEELVFGEITNGAANDLERITRVARTMITRWGMSDRLGPRVFGQREELIFLGREISEQRDYGESVAQTIDEEVHDIVTAQYDLALQVLIDNRAKLDVVAKRLLEVETIGAEEFLELMGERPVQIQPPPMPSQATSARPYSLPPERSSEVPPSMGTAPSPA
jgi:cell division protease FtsH